ncbi:ferredoxin [Peptococcus simiae]|uniref:Ferredoxin n=1 Tax=Peptococcus simiae TaxID=1643805 RepID=A0ABW9H146_9FIRM
MYISIAGGCVGCGACEALAPDLFTLDRAQLVQLKEAEPAAEDLQAQARQAAKLCPKQIIFIEED